MKICFFGNKTTSRKLLDGLLKKNIKVCFLITLDKEKSSKANIAGKDDLLIKFAADQNISIYNPQTYSLLDKDDINFFHENKFDLGICTGWQRLIPTKVLRSFRYGVYGWHGSGFEFPNGRGRSPLNWSIRLGLNKIFHNCFRYSGGVDNGPIYETCEISIDKNDYISDIQKKALSHMQSSAYRLIKDIELNKLKLIEQPNYPSISFPALTERSGELAIDQLSCIQAINIIRSCSKPFSGAYITTKKKNYRIWRAELYNQKLEKFQNILVLDNELIIKLRDGYIKSNEFEEFI